MRFCFLFLVFLTSRSLAAVPAALAADALPTLDGAVEAGGLRRVTSVLVERGGRVLYERSV